LTERVPRRRQIADRELVLVARGAPFADGVRFGEQWRPVGSDGFVLERACFIVTVK